MYDPKAGRWLSEDPLGFDAGDANLSRYVANDPILNTDPTGLELSYAANAINASTATYSIMMRYFTPGQSIVGHAFNADLEKWQKSTKNCQGTDTLMPGFSLYVKETVALKEAIRVAHLYAANWLSSKPPGKYWMRQSSTIQFDNVGSHGPVEFFLGSSHFEYEVIGETDGKNLSYEIRWNVTDWIDAKSYAELKSDIKNAWKAGNYLAVGIAWCEIATDQVFDGINGSSFPIKVSGQSSYKGPVLEKLNPLVSISGFEEGKYAK